MYPQGGDSARKPTGGPVAKIFFTHKKILIPEIGKNTRCLGKPYKIPDFEFYLKCGGTLKMLDIWMTPKNTSDLKFYPVKYHCPLSVYMNAPPRDESLDYIIRLYTSYTFPNFEPVHARFIYFIYILLWLLSTGLFFHTIF